MARQSLGEKRVRRLATETGLPVVKVLVKGGTDHRKDLCLEDGTVMHLYRDGSMEKSALRWRTPDSAATSQEGVP